MEKDGGVTPPLLQKGVVGIVLLFELNSVISPDYRMSRIRK